MLPLPQFLPPQTRSDNVASIHISVMKCDTWAQPQSGIENPNMIAKATLSPSHTVHRVAVDASILDSFALGGIQFSDLDMKDCLSPF